MRIKMFLTLAALITLTGESAMTSNLQKAKDAFDHLDKNHLNIVEEFYDKDAVFQDPIHQIKGTSAIRAYYANLYKNAEAIRFEYKNTSEVDNFVTLEWRMYLKSPSLNSGREITVDGVSLITFGGKDGKVIAHRDYFDMGEFIYSHVPILSTIINVIKSKMSGD